MALRDRWGQQILQNLNKVSPQNVIRIGDLLRYQPEPGELNETGRYDIQKVKAHIQYIIEDQLPNIQDGTLKEVARKLGINLQGAQTTHFEVIETEGDIHESQTDVDDLNQSMFPPVANHRASAQKNKPLTAQELIPDSNSAVPLNSQVLPIRNGKSTDFNSRQLPPLDFDEKDFEDIEDDEFADSPSPVPSRTGSKGVDAIPALVPESEQEPTKGKSKKTRVLSYVKGGAEKLPPLESNMAAYIFLGLFILLFVASQFRFNFDTVVLGDSFHITDHLLFGIPDWGQFQDKAIGFIGLSVGSLIMLLRLGKYQADESPEEAQKNIVQQTLLIPASLLVTLAIAWVLVFAKVPDDLVLQKWFADGLKSFFLHMFDPILTGHHVRYVLGAILTSVIMATKWVRPRNPLLGAPEWGAVFAFLLSFFLLSLMLNGVGLGAIAVLMALQQGLLAVTNYFLGNHGKQSYKLPTPEQVPVPKFKEQSPASDFGFGLDSLFTSAPPQVNDAQSENSSSRVQHSRRPHFGK